MQHKQLTYTSQIINIYTSHMHHKHSHMDHTPATVRKIKRYITHASQINMHHTHASQNNN
jgi:hypothetical protein